MVKQNKFSVLIIFYNEERALNETLKSVFSATYPKDLIEVVCVDDGSTDKSPLIAKSYNVKLLQHQNMGLSYSYNKGLEHCTGDIILFLDAHMYLKNKNIFHLLNYYFHKYKGIAGVCGTYRTIHSQDKNFVRDIRRFTVFKKGNKERIITLEDFTTFSSAIGAYKRDVFKKNKFPKNFRNSYGEDVFIQIFLHNQGFDFLYTPKIIGIHDAQIGSQKLLKKMIFEIRAMGNILCRLTMSKDKIVVPFLHYFLSYPLFSIISLWLFIVNHHLFFPALILSLVVETKDALKCFFVKNYHFRQKLETFSYLLIKELIQGLYIPYYLIVDKNINFEQLLLISRQFLLWEFKKIRRLLEL